MEFVAWVLGCISAIFLGCCVVLSELNTRQVYTKDPNKYRVPNIICCAVGLVCFILALILGGIK